MPQLSFDEDELFTEATEDIKTEIEVSVTEATTVVPSHADLVEHDVETVVEALESLDSEIDVDAVEGAIADVKKAFVLGQRADAFDSEYVSETEATISELEETLGRLRAIGSASEELRDSLSGYGLDVQSASASDPDDEASGESPESSAADGTPEEADEESPSTGESEEENTESVEEGQLEVTETSGDS